jgi:hypothetical protein
MVTTPCWNPGVGPTLFPSQVMLVAEYTCTMPSGPAGWPARSKPLMVSVYFGAFGRAGAARGPSVCATP